VHCVVCSHSRSICEERFPGGMKNNRVVDTVPTNAHVSLAAFGPAVLHLLWLETPAFTTNVLFLIYLASSLVFHTGKY